MKKTGFIFGAAIAAFVTVSSAGAFDSRGAIAPTGPFELKMAVLKFLNSA